MGMEQVPTSAHSPWQNPYVERVIGTIRRECLDHVIIFSERQLRRLLRDYLEYYHGSRCPVPRRVEPPGLGSIDSKPMVGGLHHGDFRRAA